MEGEPKAIVGMTQPASPTARGCTKGLSLLIQMHIQHARIDLTKRVRGTMLMSKCRLIDATLLRRRQDSKDLAPCIRETHVDGTEVPRRDKGVTQDKQRKSTTWLAARAIPGLPLRQRQQVPRHIRAKPPVVTSVHQLRPIFACNAEHPWG